MATSLAEVLFEKYGWMDTRRLIFKKRGVINAADLILRGENPVTFNSDIGI